MEKWEKLIEILLDEKASDAERDDAAMDLSKYNDKTVIKTLVIAANDDLTDEMIKASCGESLAMIFVQSDQFEKEIYKQLKGIAKMEFERYIHLKRDDWKTNLHIQNRNIIQKNRSLH
ncbi:hypothetical protein [Saccharibacillus sacchari]|uniref:hypothetical protein n=1 Tax=Saccharibacillus sacchari TaxID=456493 RepID=UPI0006881A5C|nr:hypothetical protein [Saccharibacillus sacchari]